MYKDLIEYLVKSIVKIPEGVEVTENPDVNQPDIIKVEIKVAPNDMGVVIGREGVTIKAIRHLGICMGAKKRQKVYVNVFDLNPEMRGRYAPVRREHKNFEWQKPKKSFEETDLNNL